MGDLHRKIKKVLPFMTILLEQEKDSSLAKREVGIRDGLLNDVGSPR